MPNNPMPQPSEEQPKAKKWKNLFAISAALIGILTPGAYLLGLSYYQGYMEAFGVAADGFPLATPDIYVFSYHAVGLFLLSLGEVAAKTINRLLSPPLVYWVILTICLCVGGLYWLVKALKRPPYPILSNILKILETLLSRLHWKNNDLTKVIGIVWVLFYSILFLLTTTVLIALLWWLLPMAAYSKGNSMALEKIKVFREKGCFPNEKTKWSNCFFLVDKTGTTLHEGLLIAKNDKELALLKKDGSYIIKLPDDYLLRRRLY